MREHLDCLTWEQLSTIKSCATHSYSGVQCFHVSKWLPVRVCVCVCVLVCVCVCVFWCVCVCVCVCVITISIICYYMYVHNDNGKSAALVRCAWTWIPVDYNRT